MMNKNLSILIVGLGLIGGSYAKGLKKQGFRVFALDNNPESIEYALKHHIIDEGSTDSIALIQKADVIISALYPQVMIKWIKNNQVYSHFIFRVPFRIRLHYSRKRGMPSTTL